MKASKRSRKLKKDEDIALDAGVWGGLQDHIPLQIVYEKLPYQELFRLRVVCKAWNHAALQRLEPKPYFVIIAQGSYDYGDTKYVNGVLSFDVASEKYRFQQQRFSLPHSYSGPFPFEVEGLIFCLHPHNLRQQGVFNIHSKTWHAIPPAPKESEYRSAIGMMVDTSERPYSFKLVVGSLDTETQIYDSQSRSWTTTSSRLKQVAKPALSGREVVTCMCNNGCVYVSIGTEILLMYSMEGDKWTILDFPEVKQAEEGGGGVHALGVWEGRIFTTREDNSKRKVTVWELVDQTKEEWVKYAIISGADYDLLMTCDFANYGPSIYEELRLVPCFCDGYLLIYNWHYSNCQSYALGMLNLATYEWEKIVLPPRTVAIEKDTAEDSEMEEGSDNEEGTDSEGGSEKGSGFEDFEEDEDSGGDQDSEGDKDSEGDEDSESDDSDPGCAVKAIRIRRKTGRSKVNFRRHKGTDIARSKLAPHRPMNRESQLVMNQNSEIGVTSVGISAKAEKPHSTMGNIVVKLPLAAKAANPFSKIGEIVMKPNVDRFECAMCFFASDVPGNYEAHKKTKVHRVLEELQTKDKRQGTPLSMLNEYVSKNGLQVNYEMKNETVKFVNVIEFIAIVGGGSGGTEGPLTKGFGRHSKRQRAKQMAAADALERIMENVSESEFMKLARVGFVVGGRKRKGGGGNLGGIGGSGVRLGGGGNPGASGGSCEGVSGEVGNSGGNVRSGSGVGVGGAGHSGDSGGSAMGVGGGGGSYPSKPNAIPVTGYNNDSPRAGSLSNNVDKHVGQGRIGSKMSCQGGHGGMPSRPEIYTERKLEKLTESYLDRIQGGRGYGIGGNGGQKSFGGAVGAGGNSYGGQGVGGIGYVGREPPSALGYGRRGLHPGIGAYGRQSQVPLVPHSIGQAPHMNVQNLSILSHSQRQVPAEYIFTQHVETQHVVSQHVHTQQATMRIPMVGGPGPGGTPCSMYDAAPQSTGVSIGTGQTSTYAYSQQYAPTINYGTYGAYAINQEYRVNTAVSVQEMTPGTSNATHSTLIAQYGAMQPQQQVPQQHVGYAFQGATQHKQS